MNRYRVCIITALVLYLALSAFQLGLPGIHYDEAFEVVPTLQVIKHQAVTTFRGNGIWLRGQLFPLMTQDYIGALNTYLAFPFFYLLGISTHSLRLMSICIGLVTICLVYGLAKTLYGPSAGCIAALLLAVNPSFVFWSRQGVFVTSVTAAIGIGAALSWFLWWQSGKQRYAVVGAFLFGLGLYAKLLFVWMIVGICLGGFCLVMSLRGRGTRSELVGLNNDPIQRAKEKSLPDVKPLLIVACVLAFLLGICPLIAYNIQTGGTFNAVFGNLTTSYYGTNNLAVFANLVERIKQFGAVLIGSHFWYLGQAHANWLNFGLFAVAGFYILWLLACDPSARGQALWSLAPFVVIAITILSSCATVSALWTTHFAVLAPWPPLAIAAGVSLFFRRREGASFLPKTGWVLVLVFLGLSWAGDVWTDVRYHSSLAASGGLGSHSDAVEDLANWLLETNGQPRNGEESGELSSFRPVAAMDWGISATVTFLTQGQVTPVESFGYEWETDADFAARMDQFISDPDSVYLWRAPDEKIFDRSLDFKQLYQPRGLEEDILEAFYERSGRPVLGATRLVPRGTAINPP